MRKAASKIQLHPKLSKWPKLKKELKIMKMIEKKFGFLDVLSKVSCKSTVRGVSRFQLI